MNGFLNASGIHINGNPGNFLGGEKFGYGMACAAETTNQHMLVGVRLVHLRIGHVMLECGTPFRGATAIDTIRNSIGKTDGEWRRKHGEQHDGQGRLQNVITDEPLAECQCQEHNAEFTGHG